jgi:hypothetical protein
MKVSSFKQQTPNAQDKQAMQRADAEKFFS